MVSFLIACCKSFLNKHLIKRNTMEKKDFFASKEAYIKFREQFKKNAREGFVITAWPFVLRNILVGKEPNYGFTPIQSKNKLENGQRPWRAIEEAFHVIRGFKDAKTIALFDLEQDTVDKLQAYLLEHRAKFLSLEVPNAN